MSTLSNPLPTDAAAVTAPSNEQSVSRRDFFRSSMAVAVAALTPGFLLEASRAKAAVLPASMITDALGGLIAFVVPGSDAYSVQQGVMSPTPGGIEANAIPVMQLGLDTAGIAPPPFDSLSELVAYALGNVTPYVNPAPAGPFSSPFANLSYAEKAAVFSIMESGAAGPDLVVLAANLFVVAALGSYSEGGVLNPYTGTLVATPVGWTISNYAGVSDGHADYRGYFQNRRQALP